MSSGEQRAWEILMELAPEDVCSRAKVAFDRLSGVYLVKSILWYLINAKDKPISGRLVRPADLIGGQIYLNGSHALPLNEIAEKYGCDIPGFFKKGRQLGGEELNHGDACLRLLPFPKVPVLILLWKGNVEFHSRCSLLFGSICGVHLPADIIWSTAMMSVAIML
ncbi:DUF3786 domain-containing protein [Chloroflexota bacterium]